MNYLRSLFYYRLERSNESKKTIGWLWDWYNQVVWLSPHHESVFHLFCPFWSGDETGACTVQFLEVQT